MVDHKKITTVPSDTEIILTTTSMAFIATTSMVLRSGNDPSENPWLDSLLLQSHSHAFLILGQAYCNCIRSGILKVTPTAAKALLDTVGSSLLKTHELRQSESMQNVVLDLLDVLSPIWFGQPGELEAIAQDLLYVWAKKKILDGESWRSRLWMARFLARQISKCPANLLKVKKKLADSMEIDQDSAQIEENGTPLQLLSILVCDGDARVRAVSGTFYATILQTAADLRLEAIDLYNNLLENTPTDTAWWVRLCLNYIYD